MLISLFVTPAHASWLPEFCEMDDLGTEKLQFVILVENGGELRLSILRLPRLRVNTIYNNSLDHLSDVALEVHRVFYRLLEGSAEVEVTFFSGWYEDLAEKEITVIGGADSDLGEICIW